MTIEMSKRFYNRINITPSNAGNNSINPCADLRDPDRVPFDCHSSAD